MTFNEAEERYRDLKTRHNSGQLNSQEFEAEVNKLLVSDEQGHDWMIGVKSGKWYYAEGNRWVEGAPPHKTTAAISAVKSVPEAAATRRIWLLISGLIGGIVLLLLIGGGVFIFLTNQPARTAAVPTPFGLVTPTRAGNAPNTTVALALSPTASRASDPAVLPSATTQATASQSTLPAPTSAPIPLATSNVPANTATVAPAPGVYVTNIRVDPAIPKRLEDMTFFVTFLNTTNQITFPRWRVEIWEIRDPTPKNSLGVTDGRTRDVPVGTIELATNGQYHIGGINNCTLYRARVVSESDENQRVPFAKPNGSEMWFEFGVCP